LSRQPATTSRTESRCRKVGLGASLIVHLALAFCLVAAPLPSDSPSPVRQVDMSVVRLQLCQVMPPAPAPSTRTPPAPKPKPKPKPELNPQPQPEPKPQPQAEPKPEPTDCDPAPPDTEPEESAETETVTAEPPAPSPPGPEASVGRPGQEDGVRNLLLQLTTLIGEEKYYPYTARRMNLEGQAYMTIDIDRYGTITGFQVESTSSAIFEKAAKVTMERVKKKFKPQGLHFDKEFRIRVPIAYRLVE
jgi:protein TonB